MARMYKSRRGKSGSSKPYVTEAPEWSNTNSDEVTNLVLDLGKSGHSTAEIGTILRDQHAVPDVRLVTGKRIGAILAENDIGGTYPEDMMNLMRQAARIIEHLGSGNHKDLHNKRSLEITEAKIRKLASYYISEGKLPSDWRYKRDELRLMVE
ncbi:MAG: 30S ribosomal protein S15 [Candidatus Poseidoniaceae archaeon]|nr:30S ribosomal protein S15 [Candidatus Poseidoniaceae archaeon]